MFRKKRLAPPAPTRPVSATPSRAGAAWSDGLGILAIRSVQIIAVVLLLGGAIWGLRSLTIVVIPVLLAIVFAAAFEPVMRLLRRVMPSALATVIVLLGVVGVIGGVVWLMVRAVIAEWPKLYESAEAGITQIIDWVEHLPLRHRHGADSGVVADRAGLRAQLAVRLRPRQRRDRGRQRRGDLPDRARADGRDPVLLPQGRPPDLAVRHPPVRGRVVRPDAAGRHQGRQHDRRVRARERPPSPPSTRSASASGYGSWGCRCGSR